MHRLFAILIVSMIFPSLDSYSADEGIVLPGSTVPISEAVQGSSDVVVGALTARGGVDAGPPGVSTYFHGRIQVDTCLYGDAKGELVCNFHRRVSPAMLAEQEPVAGRRYIIFLKHAYKEGYTVIKFVDCSDDQLLATKKLIKDNNIKHSLHKN